MEIDEKKLPALDPDDMHTETMPIREENYVPVTDEIKPDKSPAAIQADTVLLEPTRNSAENSENGAPSAE